MTMVTRHFTRRKHTQAIACGNVHHGALDTAHTALPFRVFLERIHREETLLEVRDMRQDEIGHQLEVGTHLGNGTQQHHAFYATEGMVADHHKTALFGNALQLFGADIDGDAHVFKQMIGKLTALIISGSIE